MKKFVALSLMTIFVGLPIASFAESYFPPQEVLCRKIGQEVKCDLETNKYLRVVDDEGPIEPGRYVFKRGQHQVGMHYLYIYENAGKELTVFSPYPISPDIKHSNSRWGELIAEFYVCGPARAEHCPFTNVPFVKKD